eukprot:12763329-Alexandrium_andersonii.AAC.1
MSASLVGSEMCIRDRPLEAPEFCTSASLGTPRLWKLRASGARSACGRALRQISRLGLVGQAA